MAEARFYNMETGEEILYLDSVEFDVNIKHEFDIPKIPVDLRLEGTLQIKDAEFDVNWLVTMMSMFVKDEKEYLRLTNKLVKCKNIRKHKKLQKRILELFNTF